MLSLKLHCVLLFSCLSFLAQACLEDSSYNRHFQTSLSQPVKSQSKVDCAADLENDPEQDEWHFHSASSSYLTISSLLWETKPLLARIQSSLDNLIVLERLNLPPPLV